MRWIDALRYQYQKWRRRRNHLPLKRAQFDDERLSVVDAISGAEIEGVAWREIAEARAFCQDCLTYDRICVAFVHSGNSSGVMVTEDDEGWIDLMEALPKLIPGCSSYGEWYADYAAKPFRRDILQIYLK